MSKIFGEAQNGMIHTVESKSETKDNNYFITLVGPLTGYCMLVVAKDEITARTWAVNTLGRLWRSIYAYRPTEILIGTTTYL